MNARHKLCRSSVTTVFVIVYIVYIVTPASSRLLFLPSNATHETAASQPQQTATIVISESATVNTYSDPSDGSFPVISSPCVRHEHVLEVCRIHSASLGLMTVPRLHLAGPTPFGCRISIHLLFAQQ